MTNRSFSFVGGRSGPWAVRRQTAIVGDPIGAITRLAIVDGPDRPIAAAWSLHGVTSNERYVERQEKQRLLDRQEGLGRPQASFAALIPIRKTPAWWALTQDERRAVFEAQSRHIEIGLKVLPPVARRLHHCRDLSQPEPFDFLTWFEYAPEHEVAFDALLVELRASAEWAFVDREIDIRLVREAG